MQGATSLEHKLRKLALASRRIQTFGTFQKRDSPCRISKNETLKHWSMNVLMCKRSSLLTPSSCSVVKLHGVEHRTLPTANVSSTSASDKLCQSSPPAGTKPPEGWTSLHVLDTRA